MHIVEDKLGKSPRRPEARSIGKHMDEVTMALAICARSRSDKCSNPHQAKSYTYRSDSFKYTWAGIAFQVGWTSLVRPVSEESPLCSVGAMISVRLSFDLATTLDTSLKRALRTGQRVGRG